MKQNYIKFLLRLAAVVLPIWLLVSPSVAAADRVLVFAAASMKDAIEEIASAYTKETGQNVVVSLASSGTLARQIEAGAPADIYLSAHPLWMDYLSERELINGESRSIAATNALVIVSSAGSGGEESLLAEPADLLGAGRFAMGDPVHVAAGYYTQQALENMDVWDSLKRNAAFGENVRVALAMVARRDVAHAIVYRSDAKLHDDLTIAFTFDDDSHDPIEYPVALTRDASDEARSFLAYLLEQAYAGALETYGFSTPQPSSDQANNDQ